MMRFLKYRGLHVHGSVSNAGSVTWRLTKTLVESELCLEEPDKCIFVVSGAYDRDEPTSIDSGQETSIMDAEPSEEPWVRREDVDAGSGGLRMEHPMGESGDRGQTSNGIGNGQTQWET